MVANGMPWDCHCVSARNLPDTRAEWISCFQSHYGWKEGAAYWNKTLIVMMGEFGRTPWLIAARGRDHYRMRGVTSNGGSGASKRSVVG